MILWFHDDSHPVQHRVQSSNKPRQVGFKFELKSFSRRNTPPLIVCYNWFKTKLDTEPNSFSCLAVERVSNAGATRCSEPAPTAAPASWGGRRPAWPATWAWAGARYPWQMGEGAATRWNRSGQGARQGAAGQPERAPESRIAGGGRASSRARAPAMRPGRCPGAAGRCAPDAGGGRVLRIGGKRGGFQTRLA